MKTHNVRSTALLTALLLGSGLGLAHAEPTVTVSTRGLDLRKPQDVATLYTRIETGAARACQAASSPWDAGRVGNLKKCVAGAIDAAVAQANVGALTALHKEKSGAAQKVAQNSDR